MYCGVNWGHGTVLPENMKILHTSSTISKTFCPILMKLSGILEQGRTFVMVKLILHKFAY